MTWCSYVNQTEPLINGNEGLKTLHVINNLIKSSESTGLVMEMKN